MATRRKPPPQAMPEENMPPAGAEPEMAQGTPANGAPAESAPMQGNGQAMPAGKPPEQGKKDASMPGDMDMSGEQMAQFERFHDAIMRGIWGGDTPDGQVSSPVMQLLTQEHPDGPPGLLANAAADITASALRGNLERGVSLDPPVVVLGAAAVLEELAEIMERMDSPMSDDEVAQASVAMMEMLFEKTKDLQFWDGEEMLGELEELAQNPGQFERDARDIDPRGAKAMDDIPPEMIEQAPDKGAPPPPPQGQGAPPQGESPAQEGGGMPPQSAGPAVPPAAQGRPPM